MVRANGRTWRDPETLDALKSRMLAIDEVVEARFLEIRAILERVSPERDSAALPTDAQRRFAESVSGFLQIISGMPKSDWIGQRILFRSLRELVELNSIDSELAAIADHSERTILARRARRRLERLPRIAVLQRHIGTAVQRLEMYQEDDPPESFDNLDAVSLNLADHRLIPVVWSMGRATIDPRRATIDPRIDPRFGIQVVSFLMDIRGRGWSRVYSNGFSRHPKSPRDIGHTRGRSWDVSGFDYFGIRHHLRSGRSPDDPYYVRRPSQLDDFRNGYSHWYRGEGGELVESQEFNRVFDRFKQIIRRHFGHFNYIGPGYNTAHENHFHIQFAPEPGTRERTYQRRNQMVREGRVPRTPNSTLHSAPARRR